MRGYYARLCVVIAVLSCLGCETVRKNVSTTEQYLHTQPAVVVPERENQTFNVTTSAGNIQFRCMQDRFPKRLTPNIENDRQLNECMYLSADMTSVTNLPVKTDAERNEVTFALLGASDFNCSNYLFRVFAAKSGLDTARNTMKDLATGLAAGTAKAYPGISAGLGFANLFAGTAIDNVNATYYLEKTFQAVEAAIIEQRLKQRTAMLARRGDGLQKYSYLEAVADVRAYDDACSLQRGLARLVELTGEQKEKSRDELRELDRPGSSIGSQLGELRNQVKELTARGLQVDELQKKITELEKLKTASEKQAQDAELEQLRKQKEIETLRKEIETIQKKAPTSGAEGGANNPTVPTNPTTPTAPTGTTQPQTTSPGPTQPPPPSHPPESPSR